MNIIPFNKPHLTGNEMHYIYQAVHNGKISGNGIFTQKCQKFFEERYGFKKALLTTSCTDALEMCAILADIQPGDEVIIPSYTFVSTALAFVRQGAKIIFADSRPDHPGIDEDNIEQLITPKTKAIVPVHYAGVACNMDKIMAVAMNYQLLVIEDAAQAIDSFYIGADGKKRALGSIGHLAAFSFHETKNINSGEGGLLAINDERFIKRSEIIWEKGTNRAEFFRGEVNKYGWVDIGSSFLPSEIIAAFLFAQLENLDIIQNRRKEIFEQYHLGLKHWAKLFNVQIPYLPEFATSNGHMFYLVFKNISFRDNFIFSLKEKGINVVFHYLSLHCSKFYSGKHDNRILQNSDYYSNGLIRVPLFYDLSNDDISHVISSIRSIKF